MERNLEGLSEYRLYDAAARGDDRALQELLQKDPLLLDRVSYTCSNKSPLHVATIHGHLYFVQIILNHNPDLAKELDPQQSSALHVASSKGYLEIAMELLSAAPDMCLSRDCQGRNPLHLAAMNGHIEVLAELVRLAPFAARVKLDRGMTVLHLCVEHRQLEALKILLHNSNELVNVKDDDGDTVLHMAVRDRQIETINFLLSVTSLEVNRMNLNGMTALDVLTVSTRVAIDSEIEEPLKRALDAKQKNNLNKLLKQQDEWVDKKRGSLMVVASLIATMCFQVGVNPPGGVWQDDNNSHKAGFSILARNDRGGYGNFYIINTICFLSSLTIILLLMSGLPLRRRFFISVLMVFTLIAITTIAIVYANAVMFFTPSEKTPYPNIHIIGVKVWCILMFVLVFIGHTIRLIVKLLKKLTKARRRMVAGSIIIVLMLLSYCFWRFWL